MALRNLLKTCVSRALPGLLSQGSCPSFAAGVANRAFSVVASARPSDLPLSEDDDAEFEDEPEVEEVERVPDGRQNAFLQGREPQLDLLEKYLGMETAGASVQKAAAVTQAVQEFARFSGDCGSTEVQVAILTAKISQLSEHLKIHRKDHHSKRGMTGMLNQRRKLLVYLRRTDFDRFADTLTRLGLKDNYAPKDRFSKYDTIKTMKARQAEAKKMQKSKRR